MFTNRNSIFVYLLVILVLGVSSFTIVQAFRGVTAGASNKGYSFEALPQNAAGLAIYHASERGGIKFTSANDIGLAIYLQSERNVPILGSAKEAGMAIYHASERGGGKFTSTNDAGLAIYQLSERGVPILNNAKQAGLAIYHASERGLSTQP